MGQALRTPLAERHDDELVALARRGDEQAFAALYDRYHRGLYDFAMRMLRERDAAADVVQGSFVKAWTALRGPKGVENVKAWLYAVARNLAIDELRRRQRLATPRSNEDDDPIYTAVDERRLSDPSIVAHDRELVELVWESAAALSPQEYSLLDLHLRQGLDADELASSLGLAKGAVYTRLSRLRDSLDEAVTTAVLMRRGRRDCEELDALLTRLQATEVTRRVRREVKKHVDDCEICRENKRRLVAPAELFAGLTLVPLPDGLSEAIWGGIASTLGFAGVAVAGNQAIGGAHDGGTQHGFTASAKAKAATALGTLGAVAIVGALLFPRGSGIEDPTDVHSTTHSIGQATPANVVGIAWTGKRDADAYSVTWTQDPDTLPDEVGDLAGEAGRTESPPLSPGSWWFHLRTQGDGDWTHTVHRGPFIILPKPKAEPTPVRKPNKKKKARKAVVRAQAAPTAAGSTSVGFVSPSGAEPAAGGVAGVSSPPPAPPVPPPAPPPPTVAPPPPATDPDPPPPPPAPTEPPPTDPAPTPSPPAPVDPAPPGLPPEPPTLPTDDPNRPSPEEPPTLPPEGIEVGTGAGFPDEGPPSEGQPNDGPPSEGLPAT